jgi:hypothetical protein
LLRSYPLESLGTGQFGVEGFGSDTPRTWNRQSSFVARLLHRAVTAPFYTRLLRIAGIQHVVALHDAGRPGELVEKATYSIPFLEPVRLFEVTDPLPRAYAVGRARVAEGEEALRLALGSDFDPRAEVVLSGVAAAAPASDPFHGSARVSYPTPNRVVIDAVTDAPGYVVLTETFDPGWSATVDGDARPLLRANFAFRAVVVPAGRHRVEMSYRPVSLALGLAVSVGSIFVCAAWLGFTRRATRPAR